jgi:hypothetical protein
MKKSPHREERFIVVSNAADLNDYSCAPVGTRNHEIRKSRGTGGVSFGREVDQLPIDPALRERGSVAAGFHGGASMQAHQLHTTSTSVLGSSLAGQSHDSGNWR